MKAGFIVLLLVLLSTALTGCHGSPTISKQPVFAGVPAGEQIFLVPFTTVLVPRDVEAEIFDTFVDGLVSSGTERNYDFVILKQGAGAVDSRLRSQHYFITGEIFAYVEESGCCNTTLRVRSRIKLMQPGIEKPALQLEFPLERFYNHDYSTLDQQRNLLAHDLANTLVDQLIKALAGS